MDSKRDQGIFLGYSVNTLAYSVYNNHRKNIMESISMVVYDAPQIVTRDEEEDYIHKNDQNAATKVPSKCPEI